MKAVIPTALAFVIVGVVAGVIILQRSAERETPAPTAVVSPGVEAPQAPGVARSVAPSEVPPAAVAVETPAPAIPVPRSAALAEPPKPTPRAPNRAAENGPGGRPPKAPLQDPLARDALVWVGLDPMAEAYWHAAINDPSLSAHERQDLIEDLNEEGLSDPKHPGPEDIPVILSRIRLIEAAGPYAMDQVNADAFDEAYKDLVNLAVLAMGGGEPVR